MPQLPDGLPTNAGQPTINDQAQKLIDAVEQALLTPTSVRIDHPDVPSWRDGARIGNAPPVEQPGRPAMSRKATDDSVRMIAFGGMTLMMCAGGGIVMVASDFADPTVIGMIVAAPAALAVPILAIARLIRRAGEATPPEHHHHYSGPVHQDQRNVKSKTIGLSAKTTNL